MDAVPDDIAAGLARRFETAGEAVRTVQTHISWVLLAGGFAWKLKKPVRFGFLDFSTVARRRHACEEELRLNRRLAPSLYLGVVPVRAGPDGPTLDGHGAVIDWAVKMNRLPDGALASERLAAGTLEPAHLAAFAQRLEAFHRVAPVAGPESPYGRPESIRGDALDALDALAGSAGFADAETCARLRAWVEARAGELAPRWAARRRIGRVREGHGDLHLDNVLVTDGDVTAFDCIEFDAGLRWIDTASDVAFLVMDLLARGRDDLAWGFLDDHLQVGGDFDALDVLRFYIVHRAVVRALVSTLRERGGTAGSGPGAARYLEVALAATRGAAPRLAITHGLPGSGKTRVARGLLEHTGAVRLRSDVERKRAAGLAALDDSRAAGDLYVASADEATYARLAGLARSALLAGWPVIVDAAFLRRSQRDRFRDLAAALGVPFAIVDCDAPMAVLRERVAARRARGDDASEADTDVLEALSTSQAPLGDDEDPVTLRVPTDRPIGFAELAGRWAAMR
ncbi:MAG: aminoglycoside phosphotransferase [Burkholderiales bacterium]|nr:MAG: aminoglycoside phosphotransferase [Burkholderiales bacterium]